MDKDYMSVITKLAAGMMFFHRLQERLSLTTIMELVEIVTLPNLMEGFIPP